MAVTPGAGWFEFIPEALKQVANYWQLAGLVGIFIGLLGLALIWSNRSGLGAIVGGLGLLAVLATGTFVALKAQELASVPRSPTSATPATAVATMQPAEPAAERQQHPTRWLKEATAGEIWALIARLPAPARRKPFEDLLRNRSVSGNGWDGEVVGLPWEEEGGKYSFLFVERGSSTRVVVRGAEGADNLRSGNLVKVGGELVGYKDDDASLILQNAWVQLSSIAQTTLAKEPARSASPSMTGSPSPIPAVSAEPPASILTSSMPDYHRLEGKWHLTDHVQSSAMTAYVGDTLQFDLWLNVDGNHVSGRAEKVSYNDRTIIGGDRSQLDISGTMVGQELHATFSEQGHRRSTGRFTWRFSDEYRSFQGAFDSTAAETTGESTGTWVHQ